MKVNTELNTKYINEFKKHLDDTLANNINKSILDFTYDYATVNETPYLVDDIYSTKADEIVNLLTNVDTPFFIKGLKEGLIKADKIGFMSPEELNPEKFEKIVKKRELEEYKKNNQATSNVFQCKKCKNRKCQVTQKQTRSADEPATTVVTCMECGYVFSFC
jgi:DNA-directed RNA polymerase subunit M/transcription elongation factor TFIIS